MYQSCHEYDHAPMMGASAIMMKERLAAVNLSLGPHINEPPDHIAIELEYLYFLLTNGWADENASQVKEASSFAADTMLPWVLKVQSRRLSDRPDAAFYAAVVAATIGILTLFEHPEFVVYSREMDGVFAKWKKKHRPKLKAIEMGTKPRDVIEPLAESILKTYAGKPLIDQYDIYQHLLSYWLETMKDDVYMIVEDGWKAEVTEVVRKKGDKKVEGTIKVGKKEFICELVPKELLIHCYFVAEWEAIEKLEVEKEAKTSDLEELAEEHAGEDGLLEEVTNDKGNITKENVTKRVKELKKLDDEEYADEFAVLKQYVALDEAESKADKKIKAAHAELEKKLLDKYGELSEADVKSLVVDDKWMTSVEGDIVTELSDVSQSLSSRLGELAERYAQTMPELREDAALLFKKVEGHLAHMGFTWQD